MKSSKPLGIAAIAADEGGCGVYRITQPLSKLYHYTDNDVYTTTTGTVEREGWGTFGKVMPHADVLVFQRPIHDRVVNLINFMRDDPKQLIVFEHDDNPWEVHYLSDSYRNLGTKEVKDKKTGKWIHKTGEHGFDPKENAKRLQHFADCATSAHLITTTNPILGKVFTDVAKANGKKDPQVAVLPNCLDLKKWTPVEIVKPKDEVRILWLGGSSHYPDLLTVKKALTEVCKKYPNVKLHIGGQFFPGAFSDIDPKQVINDGHWVHFEAHPFRMKLAGGDIGICPLADNTFNRCKSDIKFSEYSALGLPTVAANIPPYAPSIEHGKTGFLAGTTKEWVEHLSALVENEQLRKTIGGNARKWVEENRNADKSHVLWEKAYRDAIAKKAKND